MHKNERMTTLLEERGKTHGNAEKQFVISQHIKNILNLRDRTDYIDPYIIEVVDMIAMKLSRVATGDPHFAEHFDDIAGYALKAVEHLNIQEVNETYEPPASATIYGDNGPRFYPKGKSEQR
jgi:hypothetical protein